MKLKKNLAFYFGIFILFSLVFIAAFAPYLAPYDPNELTGLVYESPSRKHPLGTNDIGQDILSELIFGTRVSLAVGVVSSLVVTIFASTLGITAGYFKGRIDKFINFLINVVQSVPSLPLIIMIMTYLKPGFWGMVISIALTSWTTTARVVRAKTLQISELPFIKIEENLGLSSFKIMFRHIFSNVLDIILIRGVMAVGMAMMMETSLSFLGLGNFNQKSWGNILHFAFFRNGVMNNYIWWYLPPIICVSLSVLGFNLIVYHYKDVK